MKLTKYKTGRIADIISYLKSAHNVSSIRELTPKIKLDALCEVLHLTPHQLDSLIVDYSPVSRTIQGHVFEVIFEHIIECSGNIFQSTGGDTNIDGIVNGKTLQLKTPYKVGTKGNIVSYKSHKTHGAKSEDESMTYYAHKNEFPDLMIGLITYIPLRIIFLERNELPVHSNDPDRILSPFYIQWDNHIGLNAFDRIGIPNFVDTSWLTTISPEKDKELLPQTSNMLNLKTDFILNTILLENNFRIWDMNIRGFAREVFLLSFLKMHNIAQFNPKKIRPERGEKADLALQKASDGKYLFFQVKGVSINTCTFNGEASLVGVETQLTRGRINDHPTQSRMYLAKDFDYLVVGLDPSIVELYNHEINKNTVPSWEIYVIPTERLARHYDFPNRIKPIQRISYLEIQQYKISVEWTSIWVKEIT
jgi:hypothetical protein